MGGCANRPYFRIVAAQNKRARDGKHLEQIGCYDPLPNDHNERIVGVNFERLKYWIANGAHLTKPVEKLLGNATWFPSLGGGGECCSYFVVAFCAPLLRLTFCLLNKAFIQKLNVVYILNGFPTMPNSCIIITYPCGGVLLNKILIIVQLSIELRQFLIMMIRKIIRGYKGPRGASNSTTFNAGIFFLNPPVYF